jgi:hypothetical protein
MVVQSSRMNSFGWKPERMMRWSCLSSSSREYFGLEIADLL